MTPSAEDTNMENTGCNTGAIEIIPPDDWMEMEVIMGFRVWQLMFLALAGLITVVVLLCCFMKCRVPRTKQEIEADFKRKEITRRFRFLLDRVPIEDTSLRTAIEKVSELYTDREKMKKRKKKKVDEEEEIISMGSSYLFEDEKLTLVNRIKKMVGLLKEDEDSDADSLKDRSERSEDAIKRASDEDDDLASLPNVHKASLITKSRQHSEESRESSDSPQLNDSHSKLSFIQDSPIRTHDTLSKLSLLQDSPPHNGLSLLQDTPPHNRKLSKEESGTGTSESTDSKKTFGKQKTESQDSHESEQSKRQDSVTPEKSPRPKLSFMESTKGKMKASTSDSQESEDSQLVKQKSDSQDSNDSVKSKNKKTFEPKDSKLTRRESMAGQNIVNKLGQKPSPLSKSKISQKGSKSLDITKKR